MPNNLTKITAHLETQITPGTNLIYCATFQLVWNQLVDEIIHAPIALEGNPLTAQMLNKRTFEKDELAASSYLALVGFGRDGIVEKIKRGLKEKFDREPGVELSAGALGILSYAYLEKNLPFDTTFDVFDTPLPFNDGDPVQSFGIYKGDAAADQVVVLDYTSPNDFIIKLQASPKVDKEQEVGTPIQRARISDEVILAKVAPESTLLETVNTVFGRIAEEKYQTLRKSPRASGHGERMRLLLPILDSISERLQIPKIDLNIQHNFNELEDKNLVNQGFENYRVTKAIQAIKFKLDETGAVLNSEALMAMHFGINDDPRSFTFDKPFLFCLREKGAQHPYLVLWVDNADLLVKA